MNPGLRYLMWRSFVGGWRARLLQLRQVKYWLGLMGIVLYFGLLVLPSLSQVKTRLAPTLGGLFLGGMLLSGFSLSWLFQGRRAGLGFSESEIDLLFPAPVTHRELLHYKLLKAQTGLLFSTLLVVFFGSFSWQLPSFVFAWLSFFLLFNLIHIHTLFAIVVSRLFRKTIWHWVLRLGVPLLLVTPLYMLLSEVPGGMADIGLMMAWGKQLLAGQVPGYWQWGVAPWIYLGGLPFAESWGGVAGRLLFGGVLWFTLYTWVLRLGVGFEEHEVVSSKARSDALKAMREGRLSRSQDRPIRAPWFPLAAEGPLWRAIAWKNFTSITRHVPWPLLMLVVIFAVQVIAILAVAGDQRNMGVQVGLISLVLAFFLAISGSLFIKEDLRATLPQYDLIKSLPIPPLQLVRGEIYGAASVVILGCYGFLLLFLLFVGLGPNSKLPFKGVLLMALCSAFLLPAVTLVMFVVENTLTLLFPTWMLPKDPSELQNSAAGVEQLGRSVINFIIKMFAFGLFALLPGYFAMMTWFLSVQFKLLWLLPTGAFLFLLVMVVQVELMLSWLAVLFERFDPVSEGL